MAFPPPDPEQPAVSSVNGRNLSGEIDCSWESLLDRNNPSEGYSIFRAVIAFFFPALGGLLYGYDIGGTSCATINIVSPTLSGISWYNMSSVKIGLITSGSLYGALIGSILAFNIADALGRRKELILASLLYFTGAIITTVTPTFLVMIIGRFVFGVGIGLAMHAAPMYIAETTPSKIRGRFISFKEFFIVLGMVVGYGVGSLLVDMVSGWRYMYVVTLPLAVAMGVGMLWLPESPRWILLSAIRGKGDLHDLREAAINCLCRLRGNSTYDAAPRQVDEIMEEITRSWDEKEPRISEIFKGKCLKALFIGAGIVLFQQITGQPSVLYYAASILQGAGFSAASDATRVSILIGLFKLIMTGAAILVVDRIGRRPLLLGGVSGMGISLFLLGSYYLFLDNMPSIAVTALFCYVGCYQLSFGPIGWLLISEIFPLKMRGRGLSVAVLVNFGANAVVTFSFSPLEGVVGAANLFYIFGGIAVLSIIFIFFVVPETKGLTLEEIESKLL